VKLNINTTGSAFSSFVNFLSAAGYLAVVVFQYATLQTRKSVRLIFVILLAGTLLSSLTEHAT
jgi:hypothetical protein